jgi:hypothetical protein
VKASARRAEAGRSAIETDPVTSRPQWPGRKTMEAMSPVGTTGPDLMCLPCMRPGFYPGQTMR